MVNVPALETDATAFADVAGGDDATIATASNGRQTPSMQKVLKDQMLFKAPILWTVSVNVTDFLQLYESPIDGFAYAPAPGKVPFISPTDPSLDAVNWSLSPNGAGYVNGSGVNFNLAGGDIQNPGRVTARLTIDEGATQNSEIHFEQDGVPKWSVGNSGVGDSFRIRDQSQTVDRLSIEANGDIIASSAIIPTLTGTQDLGSLTKGWDKLFLQPDSNDTANIANAAIIFKSSFQTYWFQKRASGQDLQLCHDTDGAGIGGLPVIHSIWDDNGYSPGITEVSDLGSVSREWDNLFVQNSPTVSDERTKNDMGSAVSLVPVMKLLNPRIFSRKSKVVKEAILETKGQHQKTEIVQEQNIEIIDGIPVLTTVDVEKPIFKMVTLKDENGNSVKKDGKVIKYPVPVMEDYVILSKDETVVSHGRPHTGFMAQAVKQAMTDAGIEDWAGYAYHNDEGEDLHVLRLLEFIAPMLAYIQELEGRIKKIEGV